jgi:hypothetical protein
VTHAIATATPHSKVEIAVERFEARRGLDPRVPPGGHVQVRICHWPQVEEVPKAMQMFDLFHVVQSHHVPSYFGVAISDAIGRSHGGRLLIEQHEDGRQCTLFHLPLAA